MLTPLDLTLTKPLEWSLGPRESMICTADLQLSFRPYQDLTHQIDWQLTSKAMFGCKPIDGFDQQRGFGGLIND